MDQITVNNLLENIKLWKGYPSYRAETRVDWILALGIPTLIANEYKSKCKLMLPEFPLRKGTLNKDIEKRNVNLSFKVDYYCFLENGTHILIELKTDNKSSNEKQNTYLRKAKETKVNKVLEGILELKIKSHAKDKYNNYNHNNL